MNPASEIVASFKRTCLSQSDVNKQKSIKFDDPAYKHVRYIDLKTSQMREYILCPDELFTHIYDVDEKLSSSYVKHHFEMILKNIDACTNQDPEIKVLLQACEPTVQSVTASRIIRYMAFCLAQASARSTPRPRL